MPSRVTIKTIAKDLGISHITVSRALSGSPRVSSKTRKMIEDHAGRLGYVKSAAAHTLRGNRSNIVGLLLPNIVNEFYARFANALGLACAKQSHQVLIHLTGDDPETERLALTRLREVEARNVVMVPTPGMPRLHADLLNDSRLIQFVRYRDFDLPCSRVLVSDSAAIKAAVQHLADHGHSQIAYIGADASLSSGYKRYQAFCSGMKAAGGVMSPDSLVLGTPSFQMGYDAVTDLLSRNAMTAIVCGGFEISNGASMACLNNGIQFRNDLAFVGYGDPSYYQWINGGFSTLRIDAEILAKKVAAIIGSNSEQESGNQTITSRAQLIIRDSSNWIKPSTTGSSCL